MPGAKVIPTKLVYYLHHLHKFNTLTLSTTTTTGVKPNPYLLVPVVFLFLFFSSIVGAAQPNNDKIKLLNMTGQPNAMGGCFIGGLT